mmetsp:Transcript_67290/g.98447  ORF Transcript_67290/g.98447 Transcript_67290/m.98447 type:complete len:466 (+) Transcript_67290:63-1460(+)
MPFQAAPFVLATAGCGAVGVGTWHVAMGNSNEGWATCGGGRKGKGLSMVSERSVQEIASNLYHPQTGHGNIEGGENHTGLSPRLSHVVETMAGTQRRGDTPKFRPPPVENRQRFRADSVSLGEGLRCAFAHENRGPTPEQAAAIRADMAEHERRHAELERRMAEEQEGRSKLLLRDRLEREERARKVLAAKYPERHVTSGILNHDDSPRRQWQVLERNDSIIASPGVILPARHLGREVVHVEPSVMMVPQQGHNVEERLFASRPSFTPKAPHAPSPQATLPPPSDVQIQMPAQRPPAPQAGTPPILIQLGSSRMKMSRPLSPASVASRGGGPMLTPAGIGISFVPDQDGNLLIAHLVPGGPAMLSGQLYIGDRLLSVSGQPVAGKTVPEVIRMILGPKDTEVRLEVITPAAGPGVREVSIVRAAPSFVPRPSTLSRLSPGPTAPMSQPLRPGSLQSPQQQASQYS